MTAYLIPEWEEKCNERGSILPLIVGYGAFAATLLIVVTDLTSLFIAQRQTDALADAAALAAADGFVLEVSEGQAHARLVANDARGQVDALLDASAHTATLAYLDVSDGSTARVTITTLWTPPISSLLIPQGVALGATGTARTALG